MTNEELLKEAKKLAKLWNREMFIAKRACNPEPTIMNKPTLYYIANTLRDNITEITSILYIGGKEQFMVTKY